MAGPGGPAMINCISFSTRRVANDSDEEYAVRKIAASTDVTTSRAAPPTYGLDLKLQYL